MFVRLNEQAVSRFPGNQLTWCYRGDKFTTDEKNMLENLLILAGRHIKKFKIVEIYDNKFSRQEPERIILKIYGGVIEENRLKNYYEMIKKMQLPEWMK